MLCDSKSPLLPVRPLCTEYSLIRCSLRLAQTWTDHLSPRPLKKKLSTVGSAVDESSDVVFTAAFIA